MQACKIMQIWQQALNFAKFLFINHQTNVTFRKGQYWLPNNPKATYLDIHKIIVWKGGIQGGNQVKQRFATDCVTQSPIFIPWHAATVLRKWSLWRWKSLQIIRVHSFRIESKYIKLN